MRSEPFRIPRLLLARFALVHYLRHFWWFAAVIPVSGLIGMIFTRGIMQGLSVFALLWPFTLPARSIIATSKSSKLLLAGVWVLVEGDTLYFHGPDANGFKLELTGVRSCYKVDEYLVLGVRTQGPLGTDLGFVPVSLAAWGEHAALFEGFVRERCQEC